MALSETTKLLVDLSMVGNFKQALSANQKALKNFDSQVSSSGTRAYRAGQQIGTGIRNGFILAGAGIAFLTTNVALGLRSLSKLEDVVAQSNAAIKSTKGVAGETAGALRDLANKYEDLNATIDDTVIQSGENLLLTFTNIRKQAFEPALKAALDMNQALGGGEEGLTNTIRILGKALNDPSKGLTALQRVGVRFTDAQKKQIAAALKANDVFGAQSIILAELNKRFGGSFLAGGQTVTGKVAKFKDAIDDLQRALATALLPTIGKIADAMSKFLRDPAVVKAISDLGQNIAGLFSDANLAKGADFLKGAFETAKELAPILTSAAKATFGFIQAAVGIFKQLPPGLQTILVGGFALNKLTGGLVTNVAGGIVGAILGQLKSAVVNVQGGIVNVGGASIPGTGTGAVSGGLGLLTSVGIAAAIVAASVPIGQAFASALPDWLKGPGGQGKSQSQIAREAADAAVAAAKAGGLPNPILDRGGRESGIAGSLQGKLRDDHLSLVQLLRGITAEFKSSLSTLIHSTDPKAIANAVQSLETVMVANGHGSVEQTRQTIAALSAQLKRTHDPTLQAALKGAITDLKNKIPGREYAQRALAKADKIIHGTQPLSAKIAALQAIERDLKDHKLPGQTRTLAAKIDALKREQSIRQKQTTQAIKDKDLSVSVSTNVSSKVVVNSRAISDSIARYHNYYSVNRSNPGGATIA